MNKELKKDLFYRIKKLEGTLLSIGITDELVINEIIKNKKINSSYSLKQNNKKITKEQQEQGYVNVKINKINKKLKMKVNYILCDVNNASTYLRKVIKASYKLALTEIIFYGVYEEYDVDRIITKYKRYNITSIKNIYDDSFILILDVTNMKYSKIKAFFYSILDFISDINEAIGNGLMQ